MFACTCPRRIDARVAAAAVAQKTMTQADGVVPSSGYVSNIVECVGNRVRGTGNVNCSEPTVGIAQVAVKIRFDAVPYNLVVVIQTGDRRAGEMGRIELDELAIGQTQKPMQQVV